MMSTMSLNESLLPCQKDTPVIEKKGKFWTRLSFREAYLLVCLLVVLAWTIGWSTYFRYSLNEQISELNRLLHVVQQNQREIETLGNTNLRELSDSENLAFPSFRQQQELRQTDVAQQLPAHLMNNDTSPRWNEVNKTRRDQDKPLRRIRRSGSTELNAIEDEKKRKRKEKRRKWRKKRRSSHPAPIHLTAPPNYPPEYKSGATVDFNSTIGTDVVYRFWHIASWVENKIYRKYYHLDPELGHVTVKRDGYYLVYAQVVYHDLTGRWSFGIYVGDQERVKCIVTEQLQNISGYDPVSHGVYQQCYTSLVLRLRQYQNVSFRCMYGYRTILTRPEFTFWGMIRLN